MLTKNISYIFFLFILLIIGINIIYFDNIALGREDHNNDDDDKRDKKDKKNKDDNKDDPPFILPLPFP